MAPQVLVSGSTTQGLLLEALLWIKVYRIHVEEDTCCKALWPEGRSSSLPLSRRVLEAGGWKQDLKSSLPKKEPTTTNMAEEPESSQLRFREVNASA